MTQMIANDLITKVCTKCGEEKRLKEFCIKPDGKYGRNSQCLECDRKYQAQNRWRGQTPLLPATVPARVEVALGLRKPPQKREWWPCLMPGCTREVRGLWCNEHLPAWVAAVILRGLPCEEHDWITSATLMEVEKPGLLERLPALPKGQRWEVCTRCDRVRAVVSSYVTSERPDGDAPWFQRAEELRKRRAVEKGEAAA